MRAIPTNAPIATAILKSSFDTGTRVGFTLLLSLEAGAMVLLYSL